MCHDKTPLVRKATGSHFIKSTSLDKTQSPVSGFCDASNRVCNAVCRCIFELLGVLYVSCLEIHPSSSAYIKKADELESRARIASLKNLLEALVGFQYKSQSLMHFYEND